MGLFFAKRFLTFVATLVGASILTFLALEILPGDPALVILGVDAPESAVRALHIELGLDRPAITRYFDWAGDLVQGKLGTSYTYGVPVSELLQARLDITVPLALISMALSVVVAFALGLYAASHHNNCPNLIGTGHADEGVVRRVAVVAARSVVAIHVDAQHVALQRVDVLGVAEGITPSTAVTRPDVEHAVRAELDPPSVVVCKRLIDVQENDFAAWITKVWISGKRLKA